jgi:hypothetical protein
MRNASHTFIGIIKAHVIEWRKREGWSRETVVQVIVETHERISGPQTTGIRFDPSTNDAFERQKVNADRVFRWLDDETKDNNLLPANFSQSILAAMPMDIRLHCVEEVLRPLGLSTVCTEKQGSGLLDATTHLIKIARETSEAQAAVANLIDGATPAELATADRELAEAEEAIRAARANVRQQMKA